VNEPGVLNKDPQCLDKLAAFQDQHIDGHAPLLSGRQLNAYLSCRISNCHETTNLNEGRGKLSKGMQVLIREGTVSKDLAALAPPINEFTSPFLGFYTDDRNPLDIYEEGHVDYLVRHAIALGAPAAAVYRAASWSAARGFGLTDRGLIAHGFSADILLLDDLETCAVSMVLRNGRAVTTETFKKRSQPKPPVSALTIQKWQSRSIDCSNWAADSSMYKVE
jgi:adenine deaminase